MSNLKIKYHAVKLPTIYLIYNYAVDATLRYRVVQ